MLKAVVMKNVVKRLAFSLILVFPLCVTAQVHSDTGVGTKANSAGDDQGFAVETLEFQSSYEKWKLPQNETMGMARVGIRQRFGEYFNAGVDSYAAVTGSRGGFITLGVAGGIEYPLTSALAIEAGVFVGGGGGRGGYELTGGGLMLRENLGLKYSFGSYGALSAGISQVNFPDNGYINSTQMYVGYSIPFHVLSLSGSGSSTAGQSTRVRGLSLGDYEPLVHQFSINGSRIRVASGTVTDVGNPQSNFGLLGANWRTYLDSNWFVQLGAAGAAQGNSRGYMQILGGGGYQIPLAQNFSAYGFVSMGAAGGGAVNTGGGLMWNPGVGLQYLMGEHWFVDVSASEYLASSSSFRSNLFSLNLGYQFGGRPKTNGQGLIDQEFLVNPLRIRVVNQVYTQGSANWRTQPSQDVSNLGVQLDYFLEPYWYLTGQGLSAYSGNAGAYMAGLFGTGAKINLGANIFAQAEGLVGAAGGGGINTGSGLVYQANLGLGYQLSQRFDVMGTIGKMKAANGDFSSNVYGVSLGYRLDLLSAQ